MQSNTITFNPPLPNWKVKALKSLKMTSYTKVFAVWEKQWWTNSDFPVSDDNGTSWVFLTDKESDNYKWVIFIVMRSSVPMLMFPAIGDEGLRVEGLTNAQISAEIAAKLKLAFPASNIKAPTDVFVPRWSYDPFFKGAFPLWTVLDSNIPPADV